MEQNSIKKSTSEQRETYRTYKNDVKEGRTISQHKSSAFPLDKITLENDESFFQKMKNQLMFQIILLEDQQFHHFVEVVTFNLLKLNKIIIIKSLTMKIHFLKKIIKTKQKDKIYLRKIIKMRIQLLIIIFIIYIIIIFQIFQLIMMLIQIKGQKFQQKNHC